MLMLPMQSGTFAHLIVTLAALITCLAHLSLLLRCVLSAVHTEWQQLEGHVCMAGPSIVFDSIRTELTA